MLRPPLVLAGLCAVFQVGGGARIGLAFRRIGDGAVLGGVPNSCGAGDDWVKKGLAALPSLFA